MGSENILSPSTSLYKISTPSGRMRRMRRMRKACVGRKLLESLGVGCVLGCLAAQYEKSQMQPPVCSFRTSHGLVVSAMSSMSEFHWNFSKCPPHSISRSKTSFSPVNGHKITLQDCKTASNECICPSFPPVLRITLHSSARDAGGQLQMNDSFLQAEARAFPA